MNMMPATVAANAAAPIPNACEPGRETFVPLSHPPGHAQVDFGEAVVAQ